MVLLTGPKNASPTSARCRLKGKNPKYALSMHRTADDLRAISEHLLYELEMLFGTANRLRDHAKNVTELEWALHMACIESFAMHARSLEQFLWSDPSARFPDDAFAADFLPPGEWATRRAQVQRRALTSLKRRTGHEIAHLSYKRLLVAPDERDWPFDVIADVIGKAFRLFLEFVPGDALCDDLEQRVRRAWPEHLNFPVAMSFPPDQNPISAATQPLPDPGQVRQATFNEMLP